MSSLTNKNYAHDMGMLFFLIVAAIFFPWLAVVSIGILARCTLSRKIGAPALAIALVGFLIFFNATKRVDGDWYNYTQDYLSTVDISYYDLDDVGISIKTNEPVYKFFVYLLANLSGGNIFVYIAVITFVIYYVYLLALERLAKHYHLDGWSATACILFAVLAGITFTQSLHLVRQYMAGSILFLYFVFILEARYKHALVLFLLGAMIHNSFVLPAGLIAACAYLWNRRWVQEHYFTVVFLLGAVGYVLGRSVSFMIMNEGGILSDVITVQDDGLVSLSVYLFDGVLALLSIIGIALQRRKPNRNFYAASSEITILFLFCLGGLLLGIKDFKVWFLRLYFYIEWFRVIGVITIVWYLGFKIRQAKFCVFIIPLSFLIMEMRVDSSPFQYGGEVLEHLTQTVSWWVNEIALAQ
jgi:hypothetical protein